MFVAFFVTQIAGYELNSKKETVIMKNTFAAVQMPTFAYVDTLKPDTNIRNIFQNAICVTVHSTKKEAREVVEYWNECTKQQQL